MEIKVGDTLDLVGYHGKKTPVQVVNETDGVYTITHLDNSGKPDGTCRADDLVGRDQKLETETVESKPSEESIPEATAVVKPDAPQPTEETPESTAETDGETGDSESTNN